MTPPPHPSRPTDADPDAPGAFIIFNLGHRTMSAEQAVMMAQDVADSTGERFGVFQLMKVIGPGTAFLQPEFSEKSTVFERAVHESR